MKTKFSDIIINDIFGQLIDWNVYGNKKLMIVNVASECGFTSQYGQLESLYQQYRDKLVILGCPCNDFGGQEPGSEPEIATFCQRNYGVTFPLTEKISIVKNPHPLYQWLTNKDYNGESDNEVKWNFHKFLINPNFVFYKSLESSIEPLDDEIIQWI
jgi:glutathione peroxidase